MPDDIALGRRAMAAYFRSGGYDQPTGPSIEIHEGREYVVLHNHSRTLAVYRVTNRGQLKRLKRWPSEVTEGIDG